MTTHTSTEVDARILREIQSDCDRGVEKFISKLTNRRKNGLLLVPVVNVCESIKNWFQLIYQNWSWLQYCVLLPCVWLRNILRKWFVTTVLTLPIRVLQPQNFVRIFCNYSEAIFRRKEYLTAGVDLGEANETFASSPPVRALHLLY